MSDVTCRRHGRVAGRYTVEPVAGQSRIRVSCEACGAYIKWAALTPENWNRAGVKATGRKFWLDTTELDESKIRSTLLHELRSAKVDGDVLELVDLLLKVGWERALRVTVTASRAHAEAAGCPREYLEMLDRERASWVEADIHPIGHEPNTAAATARGPVQGRLSL